MNKLWEAIDVINERGWTRNTMQAPDGGGCLIGALRFAYGIDPLHYMEEIGDQAAAYCVDREMVIEVLKAEYGTNEPTDFNDDTAESKEDVIRVFEKAAIMKDELV